MLLRSALLSHHGFSHGFSLRQGGVSRAPYDTMNLGRNVGDQPEHVAENHRRMAEAVGYREAALFELSQVHGSVVEQVRQGDDAERLRTHSGDGLVTACRGLAVAVRTADCIPVLVADPQTRAVAALHAGWRGTAAGVVLAGISSLCRLADARPKRLSAAIFPHIRACCFEVGEDVASELARASVASHVVHRGREKPHVDLAKLVRAQLMAAGVAAESIEDVAGCTQCEASRFFSFRRDGQASGRHLAVIVAG